MVKINEKMGLIMKTPNNKYRIVRDEYNGYEAQFKLWWFPFWWFECFSSNTSSSLEEARKRCDKHKNKGKVVEYL